MIEAKVICDSVAPNGKRLTTMELTYPRFVHAEFMTHRQFSRNAASSRAIPTKKRLKMVRKDPVIPIEWGSNQPGMVTGGPVADRVAKGALHEWVHASYEMAARAEALDNYGIHKSLPNRLLEPFSTITVICTATEWTNFLGLRDHEHAEVHIRTLARCIKEAFASSTPAGLQAGDWHLPYYSEEEDDLYAHDAVKVSVARCARVSYLTHDGKRSVEKDLELYQRLLTGSGTGHWSPFEHVATPIDDIAFIQKAAAICDHCRRPGDGKGFWRVGIALLCSKCSVGHVTSGNFVGWKQYRKLFDGECL